MTRCVLEIFRLIEGHEKKFTHNLSMWKAAKPPGVAASATQERAVPFRHDGNLQFWRVTDSNMLISRMDLKDVGGGDGGETPRELMCTIIRNEAYYCFFGQRN